MFYGQHTIFEIKSTLCFKYKFIIFKKFCCMYMNIGYCNVVNMWEESKRYFFFSLCSNFSEKFCLKCYVTIDFHCNFFKYKGAFTNSVTVTSPSFRPPIRLFYNCVCALLCLSRPLSLFKTVFCDDYFVRVCALFYFCFSLVLSLYSVPVTEFVNVPIKRNKKIWCRPM